MNEQDMMHGMTYSGQDVTGWIATEKLDGCRAYWDGATMWTRSGKEIAIPDTWRETLPSGVHLDGKLFAGYGNRQAAVNAARYGRFDPAVRFVAFDAPTIKGEYEARHIYAHQAWNSLTGNRELLRYFVASIHDAERCKQTIKHFGGEGLMLRHPDLEYMPGRTHLMLKLK